MNLGSMLINIVKVVETDVLGHQDLLEFILLGGEGGIIPEDAFTSCSP